MTDRRPQPDRDRVTGRLIPRLALSVRQPWAWAIFHGKGIENRSWRHPNPGLNLRGEVYIHAAQGMTRYEYEDAAETIEHITGSPPPSPVALRRGGIIGIVQIVDVVKESVSPWFFGPRGLVLERQRECEFIPCGGQLGFFEWKRDDNVSVKPAKWMETWGIREDERGPLPVQGELL